MEIKPSTIETLARKFKFEFHSTCNCSGHFTQKFRSKDFFIDWRKHRYMGQFREKNTILQSWTPLPNLEKFLNEYYAKNN